MRCVLFDVDGVIVHGFHADPGRRRRWDSHIEADLGVDPEVFSQRFIKGVFGRDVIIGRKSLVEALDEFLPDVGFRGSSLSFAHYWLARDSQLNLPLLDIVRRLRSAGGVKLMLATNQEHLRAQHLWGTLGLQHVFDDIFYSARLGIAKPDHGFFERLTERIGPQDEPPLPIDDSRQVIDAANAFGWEAVLYEDLADCTGHPWVARSI